MWNFIETARKLEKMRTEEISFADNFLSHKRLLRKKYELLIEGKSNFMYST